MLKRLQVESRIHSIRIVEKMIDEVTREIGISRECYGKVFVSVIEGVSNAIIHGNNSEPEKKVDIEFRFQDDELQVKIVDEGSGFRPEEIPDPTRPENRELLNGRGVFLMKRLADKIKFNDSGNEVTMTFKNIVD